MMIMLYKTLVKPFKWKTNEVTHLDLLQIKQNKNLKLVVSITAALLDPLLWFHITSKIHVTVDLCDLEFLKI